LSLLFESGDEVGLDVLAHRLGVTIQQLLPALRRLDDRDEIVLCETSDAWGGVALQTTGGWVRRRSE
jgi:hypothetical protein